MTEPQAASTEKPKRVRRTLAERKAALAEQMKNLEGAEKRDAIRLLAIAHDSLREAVGHPGSKPVSASLQAPLAALAAAYAALTK